MPFGQTTVEPGGNTTVVSRRRRRIAAAEADAPAEQKRESRANRQRRMAIILTVSCSRLRLGDALVGQRIVGGQAPPRHNTVSSQRVSTHTRGVPGPRSRSGDGGPTVRSLVRRAGHRAAAAAYCHRRCRALPSARRHRPGRHARGHAGPSGEIERQRQHRSRRWHARAVRRLRGDRREAQVPAAAVR